MMDNKGGDQDMGDGMQCSNHPNKNNPGGICAFCLQEKLGKLVSSSFPLPIRMSTSSSSSSPPFRSENGGLIGIGASRNTHASVAPSIALPLSVSIRHKLNKTRTDCSNDNEEYSNSIKSSKTRIPFLLAKKKKKKSITNASSSSPYSDPPADIVFKRSKSTVNPKNKHFTMDSADTEDFSPRQKRSGFWSFLYLASSSNKSNSNPNINPTVTTAKRMNKSASMASHRSVILKPSASSLSKKPEFSGSQNTVAVEEDDEVSPNSTQASGSTTSSFERKVSRSRSVGCGSRSFSGDFFERISTGLGDCTLRRVESQREGKSKFNTSSSAMKERVRCGGIFGGFILTSSSSSISSSYWVSSSTENVNEKQHQQQQHLVHGKNNKTWGWAFSSPMRAFSKPPSKDAKTDNNNNNITPNLAAIPSLLTV